MVDCAHPFPVGEESIGCERVLEHVDLTRPSEHSLVPGLELLQDPGVVLGLLEVGEGDAGDEVDPLA